MSTPRTVPDNAQDLDAVFLGGHFVRGGGVEIRFVCPDLIDFIRQDLMEVNDMHAPEELWRRLSRFRQDKATDPGWAAFFRGVDHLQGQNWQGALTELYESRGVFLGRNDAWAAHLADGFIRDAEVLRQTGKEMAATEPQVESGRRQMVNDELLWQWWRITHLPWE